MNDMAPEHGELEPELAAMRDIARALEPLDEGARNRVLAWVIEKLSLAPIRSTSVPGQPKRPTAPTPGHSALQEFQSLAEAVAAANPDNNRDRALVVAARLQSAGGADALTGFAINRELKNLGHGVTNITDVLDGLKQASPALVIQTRKSGSSRQARKTYRVTTSGLNRVSDLISGTAEGSQ
jgi:hypothetical protein